MMINVNLSSKKRATKSIRVMKLMAFLSSFELVGPFLVPFFTEWGRITMFWVLALQSWFKICQLVLEIPTGIIGDTKGRKFSVVLGMFVIAIGSFTYSIIPNLFMFFLAESIYAMGVAFISGSEDALLHDLVKTKEGVSSGKQLSDAFSSIKSSYLKFHYWGFVVSAALILVVGVSGVPLNYLFASKGFLYIVGGLLVLFQVDDFQNELNGSLGVGKPLTPNYKETFRLSFDVLKSAPSLRRLAGFTLGSTVVGYYVIWLYQNYLELLKVDLSDFPLYRIIFLIGQIGVVTFLPRLRVLLRERGVSERFIAGLLAMMQFAVIVYCTINVSLFSLIMFLIVAGGLGNNIRAIYAGDLNHYIPDDQRSTVLSMIQIVRGLIFTFMNLLIGYLAGMSVIAGLWGVAVVGLVIVVFLLPKEEDFVDDSTLANRGERVVEA